MEQKRQSMVIHFSRVICACSVLTFFLFAAQGVLAAPTANAYVRVVHAAPATGAVDIFVDRTRVLSNVGFGTASSYLPVAAGTRIIKIAPAGKGVGAAVITQSVTVTGGGAYTVAAVGTTTSGLAAQSFVDNNTVASGKARVRVYHLSPNAGPVSVSLNGKTVIPSLAYRSASSYVPVSAGSYTFNVKAINANVTVPVSATVRANSVISVFAVGLYKGTPALRFVTSVTTGTPQAATAVKH